MLRMVKHKFAQLHRERARELLSNLLLQLMTWLDKRKHASYPQGLAYTSPSNLEAFASEFFGALFDL